MDAIQGIAPVGYCFFVSLNKDVEPLMLASMIEEAWAVYFQDHPREAIVDSVQATVSRWE